MDISPAARAHAIAAHQHGLITTAQALRAGYTRHEIDSFLRCMRWLIVVKGVYLTDREGNELPLPFAVLAMAALLAHGDDSCLVATSGAEGLGLQGLPLTPKDIEVGRIGGLSRHHRPGRRDEEGMAGCDVTMRLRHLVVAPEEVVVVDGLRIRDAFHTVIDAALGVDRATALCLMDSALNQELLTSEQLWCSIAASAGRRGMVALRAIAELADGRAASQVESRVRLACIDGDVAPDELQYTVRDADGNVVGIGDLAWLNRHRPLLGEADGKSVHSLPDPVYLDRRRGNALVGESCDTIRFTYKDTFLRGHIPWAVKNALHAA